MPSGKSPGFRVGCTCECFAFVPGYRPGLRWARSLSDVVEAAVQGGVTCVQLPEKQVNTSDFVAQAMAMKALLAPFNIPLVIKDRIDVVLVCCAHGVHLGQSDMAVTQARKLLPPDVFIGWTVETMEDVARSALIPVDYLGVIPIYGTPTKT